MPEGPRIPVFSPVVGEKELEYVTRAVKTGWVSSAGPFLTEFEAGFATRLGAPHAIAVSNGTVALQLVLHTIGIGPGDEVIVPSQTFVATAAAVRYCGATPVFADILADAWTLDSAAVVEKLTPRTRAVIPVDLFGLCADIPTMRRFLAGAGRSDVFILEDSAESFGSFLDGVPSGLLGDAGTFSFYGNKTITTGEGGMITTARDDLAERLRFLKDHAMSPAKRYYHSELGFNFRMTNLQAAIGLAQLEAADDLILAKHRIHARYRAALGAEDGVRLQAVDPRHEFVPWMTMLVDERLRDEQSRDAMMGRLLERGIDTRPMFYPNHLLPAFSSEPRNALGSLPVTERISFRSVGLPSGAGLTDAEIDRVVDTYVRERRAL
jgi:perosamine synthetase